MTAMKIPCGICHKSIPNHFKSNFCNNCEFWVHIKCNNISISEYLKLENEGADVPWFCLKCTPVMFPFGSFNNEELSKLYHCDLLS